MAWQVLIVDDLPIIVDSLAQLMERYKPVQFDVRKAYSGEEALQALSGKTDIVISDIKMPGMDGIQMLEAIRPQWPRCKVIFLSGYDEFEYVQKALTLGAFDYVLKADGNEKVFAAAERAVSVLEREDDERNILERTKEQLRMLMVSGKGADEFITGSGISDIVSDPGEPGNHVVQLVHKYVEANMNRYFSLSEIADYVNLNRTYLSRLYKQLTGEGVYEYINRAKLEQAKAKLLHTNMKVQEVASSLGYLSAMSFIRFFKTQTGLSPQEYREQINRSM
ncbi:response regulator transcription factor [Paenibacillus eucommiae]|uniref:YesN/AraC family two-component response regulator n=1 Tax=Paenibacillus eucommiae TaxID=1355755 RepID=A0ABS4IR97_9BACL|nr:response regulator [Paenibacillus eucommiae]MBP1990092.1 YesN/AraC family two-component response regulator [Paenibacillus eucommiae]